MLFSLKNAGLFALAVVVAVACESSAKKKKPAADDFDTSQQTSTATDTGGDATGSTCLMLVDEVDDLLNTDTTTTTTTSTDTTTDTTATTTDTSTDTATSTCSTSTTTDTSTDTATTTRTPESYEKPADPAKKGECNALLQIYRWPTESCDTTIKLTMDWCNEAGIKEKFGLAGNAAVDKYKELIGNTTAPAWLDQCGEKDGKPYVFFVQGTKYSDGAYGYGEKILTK